MRKRLGKHIGVPNRSIVLGMHRLHIYSYNCRQWTGYDFVEARELYNFLIYRVLENTNYVVTWLLKRIYKETPREDL